MKNTGTALLLALLLPLHALGQDPGADRVGRPHAYAAVGKFTPQSNSQLRAASGQYGAAVGAGWRFTRNLALDVDLLFAEQRVDTPPGFLPSGFLVSQSGRSTLETFGLGANLRAILPLGNFEPYVGAGLGFYRTTLTVPRALLGIFSRDIEKSDSDVGIALLAGVEYRFGRAALGFQYRKLDLEASFGSEVPGTVKVGGDFYLLSLRAAF